ncbi:uncharacterized protein LOC135497132 isoform X2 [Lineus longissimus]|uniref:uncharacterized protein LOC135497132 isoform X2 n=1 Tax=Lineus longissimus TaxID=88925 RepID=UPI00315D190B
MGRNRVHSISKMSDLSEISESVLSMGSGSKMNETISDLLMTQKETGLKSLCSGNPLSRSGKRVQMAKMLILTMIPILALCMITVVDLSMIAKENEYQNIVRQTIRFSSQTGLLIHYLQRERDMTALHLSSMGAETRMFLRDRYPDTDEALNALEQWPTDLKGNLLTFSSKNEFRRQLKSHRDELDSLKTDPYLEVIYYSKLIAIFIDWLYTGIQKSRDGDQWRTLVSYQLLIMAKEDMGVERTLGGIFYSKGAFDSYEDYLWYLEKHSVGIGNFKAAKRFSYAVQQIFDEEQAKYDNNFTQFIDLMRQDISRSNLTGRDPSWEMSTWWFDNMTIYIDIMFEVQLKLAELILEALDMSLVRDMGEVSISISLFVLVLIVSPLITISIRAIITDIQKYAYTLATQTKALTSEREKTDTLLYQMLPKPVAEQLKRNQHVTAEAFNESSIFFSDIVGFTRISADCEPLQVVNMLNNLYVCFDARIEIYDVYKVETIGDAYMVVSGVPKRIGRMHVFEAASMALDLLHHISHLEIPHLPGTRMQLRAGIHSGPCVAGVVGSKMPRYCLFGDSVNIASRMEANALPGKVHISKATRDLLAVDPDYIIELRGDIELAGKGTMETYWLLDKLGLEESLPCMPTCHSQGFSEPSQLVTGSMS